MSDGCSCHCFVAFCEMSQRLQQEPTMTLSDVLADMDEADRELVRSTLRGIEEALNGTAPASPGPRPER